MMGISRTWQAPQWARDTIFYQIFPERFHNGDPSNDPAGTVPWDSVPDRETFFGGDLVGITKKLDYLRELGITGLYLTPFLEAKTNHRYDISNYLKIDPAVGTIDDFRELVSALKQRDMRLVMDAVFNHCGDGFWAFEDVKQHGAASAYRDWFIINSLPLDCMTPSYQTCGGAAFLPKLNTANPDVRAYLLKVTEFWLNEGADGWRLDVPWKVPMDFWREFRQTALKANPDAYLVAEEWRSAAPWLQGDTVHGIMNYRLRDAILDYCARDHMDAEDFDFELARLRDEHGTAAPYHLTLLGSHDTPRIKTVCGENTARTLIAAVFQMTYIGIPMIYYGDEVGMSGDNDPLCRGGMVWDETAQDQTVWQTYQKLITLRKQNRALVCGDFQSLLVFNGVYAYRRFDANDMAVVILNPRHEQHNISVPAPWHEQWVDVISGDQLTTQESTLEFSTLPAQSALVLVPDTKKP